MGWDVDVHLHLRHIYDATSRMGWGGVGWDVDVHLHLRHIYDTTSRMGSALGKKENCFTNCWPFNLCLFSSVGDFLVFPPWSITMFHHHLRNIVYFFQPRKSKRIVGHLMGHLFSPNPKGNQQP